MPADKEPLVNLDEIARLLETHEGPPDAQPKPASGSSRPGLRVTGAVAAGALVAGSGLGFGLGSSITKPESAAASPSGTGFLPARGWSVVQSGTVDASGAFHAIAANVRLRSEDDGRDVPLATLASLPARGVVIVATFTTRGDPEVDHAYPVRTLPLRISNAKQTTGSVVPRGIGEYRLRAGVRSINVDGRIYFGAPRPSAEVFASAQRQLNRLAVQSERVTIFARPTIVESGSATVYGSIDSDRAGEDVTIQAKSCGSKVFRVFAGAQTNPGGGWSTLIYPTISTTFRAVWNDVSSGQVVIQRRASVGLDRLRRGGGFRVWVGAQRSFWRKQVHIQRRDRGAWKTVRSVVLTDSLDTITGAGSMTTAEFSLAVPKGTTIRAVVPLSEAKPCYLAGFSRTLRT